MNLGLACYSCGYFHVTGIGDFILERVAHFFVLLDFVFKISPENCISLSALVGKPDSPESELAVASFRKCSFREMAPGRARRPVIRTRSGYQARLCAGWAFLHCGVERGLPGLLWRV